jgi:hypothetical protein
MDLYDKLRKRYHSKSGMYINKKTCADLEEFINEENSQPIWKLNGGNPITLCKVCRSTVGYGTLDKTLCDDCQEVATKRVAKYMNLKEK